MLRRVLIVVLLTWGVLAVPSFCSAGVLEHACACEIESNCSHEESCASDPCVVAKPASESAAVLQSLDAAPAMLAIHTVGDGGDVAPHASPIYAARPAFAVPPALRLGARPLLI